MRVLVFGYQAVGHACLERILASGDECVAVVTHLDSPGENIWFPSVAKLARSAGVAVHYAEEFDKESLLELARSVRPDIIYSFYYRKMLPSSLLELAPRGAYNMHGSLLPRYRGRSPANWVIINQERETGVTLHHMTKRADAGDIVGQTAIPIGERETALSLYEKMVPAAAELLARLHPLIVKGTAPRIPQDEKLASYFGGRRPEDGEIDWNRSNRAIDALIRGVTTPFPGAYTLLNQLKLFIWEAIPCERGSEDAPPGTVRSTAMGALEVTCGEGALRLIRTTVEGELSVPSHAVEAMLKTSNQ